MATSFVPTFKLVLREDIRRWTPTGPLSFSSLLAKVQELYGLPEADPVNLKFLDPDGDKITLGNDHDLAELLLLRTPVTRVFVAVAGGPTGAALPRAASDDSETEDGLWTPARLDKYLARLSKVLANGEKAGGPFAHRLARVLSKGCAKAGPAGQQRVAACVQQAAERSPAVRAALCRVARAPAGKWERCSPAAQGLALKALGALGGLDAAGEQGNSPPGGKWPRERLDKYLANLGRLLAGFDGGEAAGGRLAHMLTKGGWNTDDGGREAILARLRQALAEEEQKLKQQQEEDPRGAAPVIREALSALAYNPKSLGLARPNIPGRALAMRAIGGDVSALPALPSGPCGGRGKRGFSGGNKKKWGGGAEGPAKMPHARLVYNVTVPDEARVAPGQRFTKVWRFANSGELPWDPEGRGLALLHVKGDALGAAASTPQCFAADGPPAPGETADLAVEMTAPAAPGRYEGFFRLARLPAPGSGEEPMRFGQRVWVRIVVAAEDPKAVVYPVIEGMAGLKVLPDNPEGAASNAQGKGVHPQGA